VTVEQLREGLGPAGGLEAVVLLDGTQGSSRRFRASSSLRRVSSFSSASSSSRAACHSSCVTTLCCVIALPPISARVSRGLGASFESDLRRFGSVRLDTTGGPERNAMRGCRGGRANALPRPRAGDEEAFRELTDPYRRELQLHCSRILGSVQDAEDLLRRRCWRPGAGSKTRREILAARLAYRIATQRGLNALRNKGRRPPRVEPSPSRRSPRADPGQAVAPAI
jgi:hypothetical protein